MAARITFAVPSPDRFRPDFPDMALMKYSHFFRKTTDDRKQKP